MGKISAVLTVKNEEKNIADCLESLLFADEIIVVDDESTDKTVEIAKKYTKKVFTHKSVGYVEPSRNHAISKATSEYILIIDADERIPKLLGQELKKIATEGLSDVVEIPRKNIIFSKWIQHSGWWPDYNIRFFRKGKVSWQDKIHSNPQTSGSLFALPAVEENAIVHYNYQSVSQFLQKMDNYSSIEAKERLDSGEKFFVGNIISRPVGELLSRFFGREGYKDGLHGLILAILQAISAFVVEIKLWEKEGFKEQDIESVIPILKQEIKKEATQVAYWFTTVSMYIEKSPIKKYLLKLKRKISA